MLLVCDELLLQHVSSAAVARPHKLIVPPALSAAGASHFLCAHCLMIALKVTGAVCIFGLAVLAALKHGACGFRPSRLVLSRGYMFTSLALAISLLAVLNSVLGPTLLRLRTVHKLQRNWSIRRRKTLTAALLRAATMNAILVAFFCACCARVARPSNFCSPSAFVAACDFVQWTGWNALLLLVAVDGHGTVLTGGEGGRLNGQVRDRPLRWHWPKLILWAAGEGASLRCALGASS
jgi:hypothetical protein